MTHDEAFLHAIRAAPNDDAPRLIYADWLEEHGQPARAEFIRLQCAFAALPEEEDVAAAALGERAEKLLADNWEDWVGPLRSLVGPNASRRGEGWLAGDLHRDGLRRFHRGFVDCLTLSADTILEHTATLARLVPLRRLRLWGAGRRAAEFSASPTLAGVEVLEFVDYFDYPLNADGARALANSPHLRGLTTLNLYRNSVGDRGVEALARAPWFGGLQVLNLADNGVSSTALRVLAAARPRLAELRLGSNAVGPDGVEAFAAEAQQDSLRTLDLRQNPLGDRGASVLAEARFLRTVATLDLASCEVGDAGAAALARSPHLAGLRLLVLDHNRITDQGARALAASPHLARLEALGLVGNSAATMSSRAALAYSSYVRRLQMVTMNPWGAIR
jgi:uncharacterized protein (TIGR02996 family)